MSIYNPELGQGPSREAAVTRGSEVFLYHAELQLPGGVLYDKDETSQEWGINGDILAVINLPPSQGLHSKRLAIVDHGEFDKDNPPDAFVKKGVPLASLGTATARYALVGLNYLPKDLAVAYCPLQTGATRVGRNRERENYLLGLTPAEENVRAVSAEHLSVLLDRDNGITIADHSTNGTIVELPEVTVEHAHDHTD